MSEPGVPEPRICYVVAHCACGKEPPDHFGDDEVLLWLAEHIGLEHVSQPLSAALNPVGSEVDEP